MSIICLAHRHDKIKSNLVAPLLLSLVVISLVSYAVRFERLEASSDYFALPSFTADKIREHAGSSSQGFRILGLQLEALTVPAFYLRGTQLERTAATFQYDRQFLIPNTNIDFGVLSALGFEGSMRGDYYHELLHCYFKSSQCLKPTINPPSDLPVARFAQISATKFVTTQVDRRKKTGELISVPVLDRKYFELVFEDRNMNVRLYRLIEALPRCYISHSWKLLSTHNEALDSILDPQTHSFDPKLHTLLEASEADVRSLGETSCLSDSDEVKLVENSPEEISVSVETSSDAVLVLADQVYPGWVATLDGHEVPILVANGFNRAIKIPRGDHSVRFIYRPGSLYLGVLIASLALAVAAYLLGISILKMRNA